MNIVIFPKLDKKSYTLLAFITIGCITYLLNILIGGINPFQSKFFDQICQFLFYIPLIILNKIQKNKLEKKLNLFSNKVNLSLKFSKSNYIYFITVIILDLSVNVIYVIFDKELKATYLNFNRLNIQMILLLLLSNFYSNTIYYIHRNISQFIITVLTSILDIIIITKNKSKYFFDVISIIIYFVTTIIDGIVISYKHYLLEIKYLGVETVSFLFGIINFTFMIIIMILQLCFGEFLCFNRNECPKFINFNYITVTDWIKIIASWVLNFIFFYLYYKCLKNFTPNHILLTFIIYIFFSNAETFYINENNVLNLIICSIIFVIIFISFLVYLEIMELNFCKLNYYTRRNILIREKEEKIKNALDEKEDTSENEYFSNSSSIEKENRKSNNKVEISPGYFVELNHSESYDNDIKEND